MLPMDMFIEAEDWNYDLYAYNGDPTIQMLLSGNVVQVEHMVHQGFTPIEMKKQEPGTYQVLPQEAIADSGIREDLLTSISIETEGEAAFVTGGDFVLTVFEGKIHTAVVPQGMSLLVGDGIIAFHPSGMYSAEYLKLYLDGQVGHLFLDTMKAGETYHLTASRILRIPMPKGSAERIEMVTRLCRETTSSLAAAEAAWRKAKRDGVGLMMGK